MDSNKTITDYENKYKEALERARKSHDNAHGLIKKEWIETIFPELKESENERIRKTLSKLVNDTNGEGFWNYYVANVLAWGDEHPKQNLEKQKEQKTTDKVNSKFNPGDWIVHNNANVYQVKMIDYTGPIPRYELENVDGDKLSVPFRSDYDLRNWTIADAKDGDILTWDDSGCITLFNYIHADGKSFDSHGFVGHCTGIFHAERTSYHDVIGAHPATKEQRDTLFEKMKEAGYEWSAEKKELRKIEQSIEENKGNVVKTSSNCSGECKKIITASLLRKNGFIFSEERFEACECYHRKFKGKIDIDLTPNHETEWELIIMSNVSSEELVKFISTVEELQKCLDVMDIDIKIKY